MDHETALESANLALSGGRRSESRISSVELQSIGSTRLGAELADNVLSRPVTPPRVSSEVWQIAGMLVVAVATLSFVVSLWLM